MTDQERQQVLKMIENGKISPEDGLKLMQTLDQSPIDDEVTAGKTETGTGRRPELAGRACRDPVEGSGSDNLPAQYPPKVPARGKGEGQAAANGAEAEKSSFETDARIARVKATVLRLWQIPLWIGVLITILSAWGMYTLVRAAPLNFWFYCLSAALLLGVLVIVAAVGSRKARWIFVDVHQKPGEKPARIFLGFPLPLKLAAWFLRNFGHFIPDLGKTNVDEVIQMVEAGFTSEQPLVVNVDEGDDGERVQVYIG